MSIVGRAPPAAPATVQEYRRVVPIPMETARLRLRSFRDGDVTALHERVFSDPEVMRYIPRGPATTIDRTRAAVERFMQHERAHGYSLWAVERKDTGELIGDCGLYRVEGKGPEVELAYHFTKPAWGKGYATEAARASLAFGFTEAGLDEIIAICFPEHTASRRVMEKCGMTYAGTARHYDLDLVKYVKRR